MENGRGFLFKRVMYDSDTLEIVVNAVNNTYEAHLYLSNLSSLDLVGHYMSSIMLTWVGLV